MRNLTNGSGQSVGAYSYKPFGENLSASGSSTNSFLYAGQLNDQQTGLYYLRARYYQPESGRFITRDPLQGYADQPQSLNQYAYVSNDPLNFFDPTGREKACATQSGEDCVEMVSAYLPEWQMLWWAMDWAFGGETWAPNAADLKGREYIFFDDSDPATRQLMGSTSMTRARAQFYKMLGKGLIPEDTWTIVPTDAYLGDAIGDCGEFIFGSNKTTTIIGSFEVEAKVIAEWVFFRIKNDMTLQSATRNPLNTWAGQEENRRVEAHQSPLPFKVPSASWEDLWADRGAYNPLYQLLFKSILNSRTRSETAFGGTLHFIFTWWEDIHKQ